MTNRQFAILMQGILAILRLLENLLFKGHGTPNYQKLQDNYFEWVRDAMPAMEEEIRKDYD